MSFKQSIRLAALGGMALFIGAGPGVAAAADAWPSRPITFIVPSSAGGGTDFFARVLAEGIGKELHQTVLVENKPGASGNIGAAWVARAPGDGYTFLVSATPAIAVNPYLYKDLPYNVETDLVPVARGVDAPLVAVVPPDSPYKTMADLLAAGKAQPGKLSFGSAGFGSPTYLGVKALEEKTGASFMHIPYKGMAPAMQDFLGGRLTFLLTDGASVYPLVQAGKAVPIGINVSSPMFPNTPAWTEHGLPGVPQSFSVMAPGKTPDAIVEKLAQATVKVINQPETKKILIEHSFVPVTDTPAKFAAQLKDERAMWKSLIERNHVTVE
jgi:tripartite-type tricarboxylate transporter receptor subunit TctC